MCFAINLIAVHALLIMLIAMHGIHIAIPARRCLASPAVTMAASQLSELGQHHYLTRTGVVAQSSSLVR